MARPHRHLSRRPCGRTALLLALLAALWPISAARAAPQSPADFLALVAQAEARAGAADWPAAARLWSAVVEANPVNGRFWAQLATARYRMRDLRGALTAYQHMLDLGYGAPADTAYRIACVHALLGETDEGFAWLNRALAMGYLDLDRLRSDPDLATLRADPRFRSLIPGMAAAPAASREAGWRSDFQLLQWQLDRLGVAPYRRRPRTWFVEQLEALAASAGRRNDAEMAIALLAIMREIGDGHSGVMHGESQQWALSLPVLFLPFQEGVFIIAADPAHRDLLGAQVLGFGGRPIREVMAALADGVSRDNDGPWVALQSAYRLRYTALLAAAGMIPGGDGVDLRLRPLAGGERSVHLAADMTQPDIWNAKPNPAGWVNLSQILPGSPPLYLRHPDRNYWFEYLDAERAVYVGFNTIRDQGAETIAAFSARLAAFVAAHPVDKLVIDLRWNNGGNTYLFTPFLAAILGMEQVNRPGHLFVLIGGRTFSAAQNGAALLERLAHPIFIGESTGSSPNFVGEEHPFTLPYSRLTVNVSNLSWQSSYPQDHRSWIAPLIYLPPTFAAYRAQQDPALDAALHWPAGEAR